MPWLTVTGSGNWGFGRATGRPKINAHTGQPILDAKGQPLPEVEMVNYAAGVHEVDADTAARAREANSPLIHVTEDPPVVVKRERERGPLTWDDLHSPVEAGVFIQTEDGTIEEAPVEEGVPLDWVCGYCEASFPSKGARDRHHEFHHPETQGG